MTYHKVQNGIAVTVWITGIAPKNIKNLTTIMFATRDLAITVIICLTPWVGQPL